MKPTRPFLRWIECSLLLGGVLALGYCAHAFLAAELFQAYENWRLEHVQTGKPAARGTGLDAATASPPRDHETSRAGHSVLGRLEIPRIHLSAIVLEGDDPRSLRLGAGHVPGTGLPGQPGNVAIAGHRDTFFQALRNIARNDTILLTTPDGSYRYVVEFAKVVRPDDTTVLVASAQPTLTLLTCYPFSYLGPAPNRFVVRAQQVR